ncbi:MAG: helix-turn-helix transcriptional regulator [Bacteroidota bacterium]
MATPAFGAEALAAAVFVSPRHLRRKLKAVTGYTPLAFIRHCKMRQAYHLLTQGKVHTLTEATEAIGFTNVTHFARLYEEAFGVAPVVDRG